MNLDMRRNPGGLLDQGVKIGRFAVRRAHAAFLAGEHRFELQRLAMRQNDAAFDVVFQLADVARPIVVA